MSPEGLVLEIVTPDGRVLREAGLDVVVLHRREPRFDVGSEVAVFPRHGPLLIRIPVGPARFRRGADVSHLALAGGFAEVLGDRVRVATPRVERIGAEVPDPARAARARCESWTTLPALDVVTDARRTGDSTAESPARSR